MSLTDVLVLAISLLPGFAWLLFYLREDCHPEPKRLIALTFFMGALSAIVAYYGQTFFDRIGFRLLSVPTYSIGALCILAFIEEASKFGAAWLAVHKNPEFDEPIDAMIYMIAAALGFATLENFGAIHNNIIGITEQASIIGVSLQTASLRFVGATLLHTLTSALLGYYWATGIRKFNNTAYIWWGLLAATFLHAIFNYLIIHYESLSYALTFVVMMGFFVLNDFEKFRQKTV